MIQPAQQSQPVGAHRRVGCVDQNFVEKRVDRRPQRRNRGERLNIVVAAAQLRHALEHALHRRVQLALGAFFHE